MNSPLMNSPGKYPNFKIFYKFKQDQILPLGSPGNFLLTKNSLYKTSGCSIKNGTIKSYYTIFYCLFISLYHLYQVNITVNLFVFVYRCLSKMVAYLDFRVFKPKYFNAYGFPTYWNWIIVSIL